jgi:hypothetical protein
MLFRINLINIGEWLGINRIIVCMYRSRLLTKTCGQKDQDSNHVMLLVIGITYKKCTVFTVSSYCKHLQWFTISYICGLELLSPSYQVFIFQLQSTLREDHSTMVLKCSQQKINWNNRKAIDHSYDDCMRMQKKLENTGTSCVFYSNWVIAAR